MSDLLIEQAVEVIHGLVWHTIHYTVGLLDMRNWLAPEEQTPLSVLVCRWLTHSML